jgi:hypothetical protein
MLSPKNGRVATNEIGAIVIEETKNINSENNTTDEDVKIPILGKNMNAFK